nr:MAG TPA: hypothetical protein [Caudoviricetes sp.]
MWRLVRAPLCTLIYIPRRHSPIPIRQRFSY